MNLNIMVFISSQLHYLGGFNRFRFVLGLVCAGFGFGLGLVSLFFFVVFFWLGWVDLGSVWFWLAGFGLGWSGLCYVGLVWVWLGWFGLESVWVWWVWLGLGSSGLGWVCVWVMIVFVW